MIIGLPFVLFIPGYAFVAALFPEAGDSPKAEPEHQTDEDSSPASEQTDQRGIDGIERIALSFGLSIAVVPLLGLVLNFTPWGIRLVPIVTTVSAFTITATLIAAYRRWQLPQSERFTVPYKTWIATARAELLHPDTRADQVLNVLLILSIVLATASVGYAVAVPKQGESFTEFYLLTETEDGSLVADEYPTEFVAGEPRELVVGIENNEHQRETYTVVVEIQRVEIIENRSIVRESRELQRFQPSLPHNETWQRTHTVAPELTGENLRLQYLLYKTEPSSPPNRSAAYRELHLWVNVTTSNSA